MTARPSAMVRMIFATPLGFGSNVFEVDRLPLDAALRRSDVVRELPGFVDGLRLDAEQVLAIPGCRQPLVLATLPVGVGEPMPLGIEVHRREHPDAAVELAIGQAQPLRESVALEQLVPSRD